MPNLITKLGNEFGFDVKYELFDQALKTNFSFKKFLSQIKEKNISGISIRAFSKIKRRNKISKINESYFNQ